MKKIILTSLIIFSPSIFAHDLPNTFEAGQPIVASEVNENFADIESEITEIKSIIESGAASINGSVEFSGFTEPAIFGTLGLKVGRSMCPTLYPGSRICSVSDIESIDDWENFSITSPFVLVSPEQINPCSSFSSREAPGTSVGFVDINDFVGYRTAQQGNNQHYNSAPDSSLSGIWLSENTQPIVNLGNNYYELGYTSRENQHLPESNMGFSSCNVTIPAACCK